MKFALIGHKGHFNYYHQVLSDIPEFEVVAVAAAQAGACRRCAGGAVV